MSGKTEGQPAGVCRVGIEAHEREKTMTTTQPRRKSRFAHLKLAETAGGQSPVAESAGVAKMLAAPAGAGSVEFREVELSLVDPHERNIRHEIKRDEAFDQLVESIRVHGLQQPLVVTDSLQGQGRFTLLAGHRRLVALQVLGAERAMVQIRRGVHTPAEQVASMLVENTHREQLNKVEEAEAVDLLAEAGLSEADIRALTGHSASWVSSRKKLLAAPAKTRAAVEQGHATLERALMVAQAQEVHEDDARILDEAVDAIPSEWAVALSRVEELREWREKVPRIRAALTGAGVTVLDTLDRDARTGEFVEPEGYSRTFNVSVPGDPWASPHRLDFEDKGVLAALKKAKVAVLVSTDPDLCGRLPKAQVYAPDMTQSSSAAKRQAGEEKSPEVELEELRALYQAWQEARRRAEDVRESLRFSLQVRAQLIQQRMASNQPFSKDQAKAALVEALGVMADTKVLSATQPQQEIDVWRAVTCWDLEEITGAAIREHAEAADAQRLAVMVYTLALMNAHAYTPDPLDEFGVAADQFGSRGSDGVTAPRAVTAAPSIFGPALTPDSALAEAEEHVLAAATEKDEAKKAWEKAAKDSSFGSAWNAEQALAADHEEGDE